MTGILLEDEVRGAQLLELNAPPGLAIQLANGRVLLPRLRHVESHKERMHRTAEQRVDYVMKTFTADGLSSAAYLIIKSNRSNHYVYISYCWTWPVNRSVRTYHLDWLHPLAN